MVWGVITITGSIKDGDPFPRAHRPGGLVGGTRNSRTTISLRLTPNTRSAEALTPNAFRGRILNKLKGNITIIYTWSDDGWWVAEVAELPGAISQGRDKAEAKANVLDALSELMLARRELALKSVEIPENVETIPLAS